MAWKIELADAAERDLDKLDPQMARRILAFLHDRVVVLDNPRSMGQALKGSRWGSSGSTGSGITALSAALKTKEYVSSSFELETGGRCIGRHFV